MSDTTNLDHWIVYREKANEYQAICGSEYVWYKTQYLGSPVSDPNSIDCPTCKSLYTLELLNMMDI